MKVLTLISILFFLTSCYGVQHDAGYSVYIDINHDAKPTTDDVKMITEYLDNTVYDVIKINDQGEWKYESYKIILDGGKFSEINHKYISFGVEYYFTNKSNDKKELKELRVRIGNTQEGSTPVIQKEIDLIADDIEKKLKKRFGDKNFSIKRKIVTPM